MIRVLLVDDQELFRAGLRTILGSQPDIEIVGEAADGAQAVEAARRLEPDLVLMDIRMPEMDGVEATQRILGSQGARTEDNFPLPRVVVLTTFDLDARAAEAIRAGASGFLLKTATPSQLHDAVRAVHSGNGVIAPDDLIALINSEFSPRQQTPPAVADLTDREREVMQAVARGLSNAEIGAEIFSSESTVKTHVGNILRKLALRDRVQIVVFAFQYGLTQASSEPLG